MLVGFRVPPAAAQRPWRAPSGDWLETLPPGQFPAYLKEASPKAREMHRFAAAHGETLQYIPCYHPHVSRMTMGVPGIPVHPESRRICRSWFGTKSEDRG
jgi:hypothetical protein